ncbi:polyphenol oxidase [Azospirillaceae bacterium]
MRQKGWGREIQERGRVFRRVFLWGFLWSPSMVAVYGLFLPSLVFHRPKTSLSMIASDVFQSYSFLRHGFFTRQGGVSEGLHASLNVGYGSQDKPEHVTINRARAMAQLGLSADRLTTVYQIHSATPVTVERPWTWSEAPKADALVTATPGIALGILTADCAPVLLADPEARVIGAAHAGWRGAQSGVISATIQAMVCLGARVERMAAAIGPCIGQSSYEVGPEFPAPFLAETPENQLFFTPAGRAGHFLFDLGGYVARKLQESGIVTVQRCPFDTAVEETLFFSYRRSTLRKEPDYGRMLSSIALEPF